MSVGERLPILSCETEERKAMKKATLSSLMICGMWIGVLSGQESLIDTVIPEKQHVAYCNFLQDASGTATIQLTDSATPQASSAILPPIVGGDSTGTNSGTTPRQWTGFSLGCDAGGPSCDSGGCDMPVSPSSQVYSSVVRQNWAGSSAYGNRGYRTLSLFGGLNWLIDSPNSSLFNGTSTLDDEYIVGGAIGRQITQRLRTELEFAYRRNQGQLNGVTTLLDSEVNSVMINGFYNLPQCWQGFRPYVGAGLGLAHVDFQESVPGTGVTRDTITNTNFAWQGIGGVERCFGRAVFFAEYRFFASGQVELINNLFPTQTFEGNYFAHNALFGLRFNF